MVYSCGNTSSVYFITRPYTYNLFQILYSAHYAKLFGLFADSLHNIIEIFQI